MSSAAIRFYNRLSDDWLTMTTRVRDRLAHGFAQLSLRAWGQCDHQGWQTAIITPMVVGRDIERTMEKMRRRR